MIHKGYYTTTNSDLYFYVVPRYRGKEYIKCRIVLYYKHGIYKDTLVESKNYKVYKKNITHWIGYSR